MIKGSVKSVKVLQVANKVTSIIGFWRTIRDVYSISKSNLFE